jgi:hypothetical protein
VIKKEYDLSKLKARKNPYTAELKRQVTIRVRDDAIKYYKSLRRQ